MARPALFGPKSHKYRYQGFVSGEGFARFEQVRAKLAGLVGWAVDRVSDGDVMDYLARGHEASVRYLVEQKLVRKLEKLKTRK